MAVVPGSQVVSPSPSVLIRLARGQEETLYPGGGGGAMERRDWEGGRTLK